MAAFNYIPYNKSVASSKPKLSTLTKKADAIFSKYIRLRDSTAYLEDEEGNSVHAGNCVTCGRLVPTEGKGTGHAGHFIERGCKLTRYDPRNVHLQCNYCNTYKYGEQYKHSQYIARTHGQDVLDELVELERRYKADGHKYTIEELTDIVTLYTRLFRSS